MEKEHKDLLITDLCGRLPHKVIVEFVSYEGEEKPWIGELSCKDLDCFIHDVGFVEIKPYLFPLSSMTEEQEKEFKNLYYRYHESAFIFNERFSYNRYSLKDIGFYPCYLQDWLLKNHFDIYGLIPKGLANDATNKNIY